MRVPVSTYRIQLRPGFGFRETTAILKYLKRLGITDVYASPLFQAQPGSLHGYDVIDPNRLNPELGTPQEWRALTDARRALNMGWVQDIVPNHMAFSGHNPMLTDIFENGFRSAFYSFFDIQWDHPQPLLQGKVRTPFLADTLDACLSRGEINLAYSAQGLGIVYFENRFAVALASYAQVFEPVPEASAAGTREPEIDVWRRGVQQLIQVAAADPSEARAGRITDAKQSLWELYNRSQRVQDWTDRQVAAINAPQGSLRMQRLLEAQHFELCFWQTAADEINYRRFFSINGLIGVRQEDPRVFDYTHRLIRRSTENGDFTGLRVDHVDGLADPAGYLGQLRQGCPDSYIVVEKILALDEALESSWPIQGTTGYEFSAHLNALFTLPDHESELSELYQQISGQGTAFEEVGWRSKEEVLHRQFAGDLANLVYKFTPLMHDQDGEAPPSEQLAAALEQILIHLPVYRTYLAAGVVRPTDREVLSRVVDKSRRLRPDLDSILARLKRSMLRETPSNDERVRGTAVSAFEQLSAALAAKGIEDTALYRYNRLIALNEVGGAPEHFDGLMARFNQFAAQRAPYSLSALSTHDTKRSADVRARMLIIAEIPDEWRSRVTLWRRLNAGRISTLEGGRVPDPEIEYMLYQTLVGTFTEGADDLRGYTERIVAYSIKAAREAKQHTRWSAPDTAYEAALQRFVESILTPGSENQFLTDMALFAAFVGRQGRFNALSQCLIHLTAPGIPDIYQGSELFDDSLVDPDNRREVDFKRRDVLLDGLLQLHAREPNDLAVQLTEEAGDRIKLYVTYVTLQLRKQNSALFGEGRYHPITTAGRYGRHVVAFARELNGLWSLTVVPRFLSGLMTGIQAPVGPSVWADTHLMLPADAPALWLNRFTGQNVSGPGPLAVADLLMNFPVALATGEARP